MNAKLFTWLSALPASSYLLLALYASTNSAKLIAGTTGIATYERAFQWFLNGSILASALCVALLPLILGYKFANWSESTVCERRYMLRVATVFLAGAAVWMIDYACSLAGIQGLFCWYFD